MTWRLEAIAPDLVEQIEREPEARLRAVAEGVAAAALRIDTPIRIDGVLDEAAWDLQERMDAGQAAHDEYLAAFRRARAVTSLWFALDSDPMVAAMEASYEARAAADDAAVRREITATS